jgi:hypothetical protein
VIRLAHQGIWLIDLGGRLANPSTMACTAAD